MGEVVGLLAVTPLAVRDVISRYGQIKPLLFEIREKQGGFLSIFIYLKSLSDSLHIIQNPKN